jgi:glycosyltransferase involved in cell wall biosynthesis
VISFVVPVYDEQDNVGPLLAEITRVAAAIGQPYEIVFVNDGSRDDTLARLAALRAADRHLRIVDLDGNFGEAAAVSAGFAHARGDLVVTLDGDGQNDPADVPRLLAALRPGIDVVSGRRRERKEDFWTRVLPSRIANALIARTTGVPVSDCGCGLKVYRRHVIAGTQLPRGMNRFLPAILGIQPARVAEVWVDDRRRSSGRSHYGLSRTFAVLRDLAALPFVTRAARHGHFRLAQLVPVAGLVVVILAALGLPAAGATAVFVVVALAGVVGAAIAHGVTRITHARAHGVYRVRRVIG